MCRQVVDLKRSCLWPPYCKLHLRERRYDLPSALAASPASSHLFLPGMPPLFSLRGETKIPVGRSEDTQPTGGRTFTRSALAAKCAELPVGRGDFRSGLPDLSLRAFLLNEMTNG
jgi:hypothetical protein